VPIAPPTRSAEPGAGRAFASRRRGAHSPSRQIVADRASPGMMMRVSEGDNADIERASICPSCGVTALPADTSNVTDSGFVCENPDCDAFGDAVES
jgi:hypothetical protein